MAAQDIATQIRAFNRGRDPRRLALKYEAMRRSPFVFLRGTCHLFFQDLPRDALLARAPLAWISGDLHFENFGSYKGDNRLAYFDLNDFDEACLAPCTWELLRFVTSVLVGGRTLGLDERGALDLCRNFLEAYSRSLAEGKPRWIERPIAQGMVKDLLKGLKRRDRGEFLDGRTKRKPDRRVIRIDGKKALAAAGVERKKVAAFMRAFATEQPRPRFFRLLDVADRIAGTGSLGVERYVMLVEGRGSPDGNFLLDLKEARPSALIPYLKAPQPRWRTEAERVVSVQRCMQAIPPALLVPVAIGNKSFVFKEHQPSEDRVQLDHWNGKLRRLERVMAAMGKVVAWGQLRAAGWRGSIEREELSHFGRDTRWHRGLVALARERGRRVVAQWREYREWHPGTR